MTDKESRKLRQGDAVVYSDGVKGRVLSFGNAGVTMEWDDGQQGTIAHEHMSDVSRDK